MFELDDENLTMITQVESVEEDCDDVSISNEDKDETFWTGSQCAFAMKEIMRYAVSKNASSDELYAITLAQETLSVISTNPKENSIMDFLGKNLYVLV